MRLLYVTGWTSARLPCYPSASHGKVSPDAVVRGFRDRTADAADVSPRWELAMTPVGRLEPLGEAPHARSSIDPTPAPRRSEHTAWRTTDHTT